MRGLDGHRRQSAGCGWPEPIMRRQPRVSAAASHRRAGRRGFEGLQVVQEGLGAAPPGEARGVPARRLAVDRQGRSEEHTSELQSLMRISSAVFGLKKKKDINTMYNDYATNAINE